MYKLMVADDEYNIRDGISNAIPWADHNIEVVAQASNAIEAIEEFEQFNPDIVITDIIMDDMTGLELIEISGSKYIYPKDKEKLILDRIGEYDVEKISGDIDQFFMDLQTQNYSISQIKAAVMQLTMSVSSKLMDMGMNAHKDGIVENNILSYDKIEQLDTIEEMKVWMNQEIRNTVNDISLRRNGDVKNIIGKAQKHILDHFSDYCISLQTISQHVHLSPAYFSKLYKKEIGDSYIDFITKVRIDKAKEFLKQTDMRISDIGLSVGYPNPQYFSTLFKKYTGISPAEYRLL